jgi:anti-sigma factor RsiW
MSCEELRHDYILFALGTLTDPERGEIREHLDRGCPNCLAGVREAEQYAFAIGASAEGPEPPRELRKRVLAIAGAEKEKRFGWFAVFAPAAAVAVAFGLGAVAYVSRQTQIYETQLASLRSAADHSRTELAALQEAMTLIQAPDTREVSFGEGKPAPPRGRVFVHPATGVLLIASRLTPPPAGKTWEMWIIRDGKPAPAGLFQSDSAGNAIHLFRPDIPIQPKDIVAVTLEAAGGVPLPTTTPVIAAQL